MSCPKKTRAGHGTEMKKWNAPKNDEKMGIIDGRHGYITNSNAWSVQHVEPTLQRQQWAKIR